MLFICKMTHFQLVQPLTLFYFPGTVMEGGIEDLEVVGRVGTGHSLVITLTGKCYEHLV